MMIKMTNKCFICGSIRRIAKAGGSAEIIIDDLELSQQELSWKNIFGEVNKIEIFKCKECLEFEKEIKGDNIEDRKKEEPKEKVTEDKGVEENAIEQ
jgi:hypothetical protein